MGCYAVSSCAYRDCKKLIHFITQVAVILKIDGGEPNGGGFMPRNFQLNLKDTQLQKAFLWGVIQFHHVLVHISQIDVFYPASCSYISLIDGGNPSRGRFYAKEFPASLQGYLAPKSLLWGVGECFFLMLTIKT